MDFGTIYRYILPALTATRTITKAVIIEMLFILTRWNDIKIYFSLDVFQKYDCFIVSQFTNIPICR